MKRTALCIGGPHDRKMIDFEGNLIVVPFMHRRRISWRGPFEPPDAPLQVQRFEYKIQEFSTPSQKYYFAVGPDDGPDLIMRVLMDTYATRKK